MTKPDEALHRIIDEAVRPRLHDQKTYLARTRPDPLPVARAELLYLWDDYRAEYLDFAALANPLGHAHPKVAAAITEHTRYYGHTAPQGQHCLRWPVEYARDLSAHFTVGAEPARQVLFCEGEREAVYQATRLAMAHNRRRRIAVLDTGWHDWLPASEVDLVLPLEEERLDPDRHAALLLATVDTQAHPQRSARDWMLAARARDIPVIVDETVTGFARTGLMWGQEHTGLVADLVVLGGPVGGGWPLGAVIAAPDYFPATVDVSGQSGHPVACAAGAATLAVLSMGVREYMEDTAEILATGLSELHTQFPHYLAGHHGVGLLRGLRFQPGYAERFPTAARAQGLYVAPPVGNTIVLSPVLITSTNEIRRAVDLIASALLTWDDNHRPV